MIIAKVMIVFCLKNECIKGKKQETFREKY